MEKMNKPKIIAYYLPQFHPFKENDEWWGKGFTEWTNVGKAKPLFRGHYQPKIPGELGYYDLRIPEIAEAQAELAREAGIYGFCYWHYWFGNGKELMEMPFKRAVETGKPDFPFCLGWANESWQAKLWNKDYKNGGKSKGKVLIEMSYSDDDHILHFNRLKKAFADKRYIKIDKRPFFLIYRPFDFPNVTSFMHMWNDLIKESGIADSFYFVAHAKNESEYISLLEMGFDAVNIFPLERKKKDTEFIHNLKYKIVKHIFGIPKLIDYRTIIHNTWENGIEDNERVIPTIIPNFDHSPRSGKHALILVNSTPDNWRVHVNRILSGISLKNNKVVMLKSWNEWGEGNYMEPDLKYGKDYIRILSEELKKYE